MRFLYTLLFFCAAAVAAPDYALAVSVPQAPATSASPEQDLADVPTGLWAAIKSARIAKRDMTRTERKAYRADRKSLRQQVKAAFKSAAPSTNKLLLIIIAILLAPLAMFLYEGGVTNRFWLSLLLWFLFVLPGILYTVYIIGSDK